MLYSIAPMQSLFQIYSGVTVRRFDYVFTVLQSINYFAMIMLYVWTIKCVCKKETIVEKS